MKKALIVLILGLLTEALAESLKEINDILYIADKNTGVVIDQIALTTFPYIQGVTISLYIL